MTRLSPLSSPLLLGFDQIERTLDRLSKGGDGYPPYNVERLAADAGAPDRLRITLAVAGFTAEQLSVTLEEGQLVIRGRQTEEEGRVFLHRGIAARQFQRVFVLAEGMDVLAADLANGLLTIDLIRPQPERLVRKIDIVARSHSRAEDE
ncbi:Hsp20 family protein [Flaviflagellibacter deserti]|uniref:Hsp20 family protein n=1 Tax=Flaviflagellibacter deserti TaxID=2267266 RepID=A0ABV9YZH8_9HYPH